VPIIKNTIQPFSKELISLAALSSVIASAVLVWNKLFLNYVASNSFKEDIFRPAFHKAIPPIYGVTTDIEWTNFFVISVLMFGALFLFSMLERKLYKSVFIVVFFLFFTFLFSKTENRFSASIAHYSTYLESVGTFTSPMDVVQHYTEKQAALNVHSAHYPPGNLWLIKGFDQYSSIAVLKCSLYALMALSLIILFSLQEQVNLVSVIAIPALLIYPSLDVVALPFFFFSVGLFLHLKVASPMWKSLFLGVVSSVWLFFSFSVFVFWLFLFVIEVISFFKTKALKLSMVYHLAHGAVIVFFFLMLSFLFQFSIIENFRIALAHNIHINSNYFDHPVRFLFRSTGNALEFCLGVGFPILLLFRKSNSLQPNFRELRNAFLLTLAIASCCGLFFMETDRVWFFLIPIVILIANEEFQSSTINFRRIFSFFAVLYMVWFELSAIHFC
jgi:hypothetical protein